MPVEIIGNATTDSLSSISSYSASVGGILLTIAVFLGIVGAIFLVSRSFRQTIIGAVLLLPLVIIYKVSRWIAVSAVEQHDYTSLRWLCYIIGFIVLSSFVGWFITKHTKKRNKFIMAFEGDKHKK